MTSGHPENYTTLTDMTFFVCHDIGLNRESRAVRVNESAASRSFTNATNDALAIRADPQTPSVLAYIARVVPH